MTFNTQIKKKSNGIRKKGSVHQRVCVLLRYALLTLWGIILVSSSAFDASLFVFKGDNSAIPFQRSITQSPGLGKKMREKRLAQFQRKNCYVLSFVLNSLESKSGANEFWVRLQKHLLNRNFTDFWAKMLHKHWEIGLSSIVEWFQWHLTKNVPTP